jgi:hypothetical protein
MAAQMGKDGFISFATTSTGGTTGTTEKPTYIDSWNLNGELGLAEVTAFGDITKKYSPTIRRWTATASGTLDMASTELQYQHLLEIAKSTGASMNVFLRFYDSTGKWSGVGLLTSVSMGSQVGSKVTANYNFQGTSGLAYA